ncbi:MAG: sulfur carrier protein ThiS [Candidatus Methanomethylophilaceae archaeon]|nr:sulfur carrier protein ThiS [Candidatus Methanomethylophilaceae archaeon]
MIVNGSSATLDGSSTISEWLSSHGYDPSRSAVLLNGAVVPRNKMGSVALSEGDEMEIVSFVGGG